MQYKFIIQRQTAANYYASYNCSPNLFAVWRNNLWVVKENANSCNRRNSSNKSRYSEKRQHAEDDTKQEWDLKELFIIKNNKTAFCLAKALKI